MTEAARVKVEEVPNAVRYSDGTILLKNVRLSYPTVFVARAQQQEDGTMGAPKFSIVGLMPKSTHAEAKKLLVNHINRMLKENNKDEKLAAARKFLRDGDPKDEDDAGKPENAGMWTVNASEKKRPRVLDRVKDPKTGKPRRLDPDKQEDVDKIYGGCWGNILIKPWWQNNTKGGKRVNAALLVVQFKKDGEPFGSGRITDDDIDESFGDEVEDEETAGDDDVDDL